MINKYPKLNRDVNIFEISKNYAYTNITFKKGTRLVNLPCPSDSKYCVIDDLSAIPKEESMLKHDATYYGLPVSSDMIDWS